MKSGGKSFAWRLTFVGLIVSMAATSASAFTFAQLPPEDHWVHLSDCDFPAWIVLNHLEEDFFRTRKVLVFINKVDFTEENMKSLFGVLSQRHPDPAAMYITVVCDKVPLQRLGIKMTATVFIDEFDERGRLVSARPDSPDKRKEWRGVRADFYRSQYGEESFHYKADPNSENTKYVKIRDKIEPTYTGDTTHDLLLAARKRDVSMLEELLAKGADVDSRDGLGYTALMNADILEVVRLLLKAHAKVDFRNRYGQTALAIAADAGHKEIVALLIEHGAEINSKDKYGYTPLMLAAKYGRLPVVEVLVKKGADTAASNDLGMTALALARKRGKHEIVRYLENLGVNR